MLQVDSDDDIDESEEKCLPGAEDPFSVHYERCLSSEAAERLVDSGNWQHDNHRTWPHVGPVKHSYPSLPAQQHNKPQRRLLSNITLPTYGAAMTPEESPSLDSFSIKESVHKNIGSLSDTQLQLLQIITGYRDLYYPLSTHEYWDDITNVYCIHALNHVLKSRARILKNNAKLKKVKASKSEYDLDDFTDQGYARPKVLILLPSKHSAYR